MIKFLPTKKSSGYTIIEIIISIFIIIILFSAAQAGYRVFILEKSLETAKSQIISDLRLAQSYAMSGKKPTGCSGLNGYNFTTSISNNSYTITANCGGDTAGENVEIKTVELSKVAKGINIANNISLTFKIMGMGTNISAGASVFFDLNQQTTGYSRRITISSGGDIK
jgi:type IV fimbrial biogenesis protein FimT